MKIFLFILLALFVAFTPIQSHAAPQQPSIEWVVCCPAEPLQANTFGKVAHAQCHTEIYPTKIDFWTPSPMRICRSNP